MIKTEFENGMKNKKRNVLITNGMSGDVMIILTDAPATAIKKWCHNFNVETENGINTYFDSLKKNFSVEVLHDSELDTSNHIEEIGFEEVYELGDY